MCAICSKSLTFSTSVRAALIDHAKGSKHKTELSKVASFFNKKTSNSLTTSIFRSDFLLPTKEFFGWKIYVISQSWLELDIVFWV